jgi:hypothetical protein
MTSCSTRELGARFFVSVGMSCIRVSRLPFLRFFIAQGADCSRRSTLALAERVAERLIGSIRCECVDHVIVLGEAHLRRILQAYARYYNDLRTHRSLDKDAPFSRPVQRIRKHHVTATPRRIASPTTCESEFSVHTGGPPSQTWRTFLRNHAEAIAAIGLCVVPTLTFVSGSGPEVPRSASRPVPESAHFPLQRLPN